MLTSLRDPHSIVTSTPTFTRSFTGLFSLSCFVAVLALWSPRAYPCGPGPCTTDSNCCGNMYCLSSECKYQTGSGPCIENGDCISGHCDLTTGSPTENTCLPQNEATGIYECYSNLDCGSSGGFPLSCDPSGAYVHECIEDDGASCTSNAQCLSDNCSGTPPHAICLGSAVLAICQADEDCNAAGLECVHHAAGDGNAGICLLAAGQSCSDPTHCVSGNCATTCQASGTGCSVAADCPAGDNCVNGLCGIPVGGVCSVLAPAACMTGECPIGGSPNHCSQGTAHANCLADSDCLSGACVQSGRYMHTCRSGPGAGCASNDDCTSGNCNTTTDICACKGATPDTGALMPIQIYLE